MGGTVAKFPCLVTLIYLSSSESTPTLSGPLVTIRACPIISLQLILSALLIVPFGIDVARQFLKELGQVTHSRHRLLQLPNQVVNQFLLRKVVLVQVFAGLLALVCLDILTYRVDVVDGVDQLTNLPIGLILLIDLIFKVKLQCLVLLSNVLNVLLQVSHNPCLLIQL